MIYSGSMSKDRNKKPQTEEAPNVKDCTVEVLYTCSPNERESGFGGLNGNCRFTGKCVLREIQDCQITDIKGVCPFGASAGRSVSHRGRYLP